MEENPTAEIGRTPKKPTPLGMGAVILTIISTIVWTILSCQDFRSGVKYGLSTLLHL